MLGKVRLSRSRPARLEVADIVQEAILRGQLAPGQEIPQLDLARRLGLSQSAVREALQELEHRGLVVRRGRRREVIRLTEDDLADLYQVRAVLEPLACRLAAYGWNKDFDDRLENCLYAMRRGAADKDYPAHARADAEFHRTIWRHQPNRALERQLEILWMPYFAYDLVERAPNAFLDFERSLRQHRTIITALRTRDGERAEKVVRRLIERFHRQDIADFRALERSQSLMRAETVIPGSCM
jgi:DNA-binding GntR family transcriptional regulator